MKLIDNKNHGKLVTELRRALQGDDAARFAVLSGLFSIYGFAALKKELLKLKEFRLLLAQWNPDARLKLAGSGSEVALKNKLDQHLVAKQCAEFLRKRNVAVKALKNENPLAQALFHVSGGNQTLAVQGNSYFTASGLGDTPSDAMTNNMATEDAAMAQQMLLFFEGFWQNKDQVRDIKKELLEQLDFMAADKPGNLVYFILLYHIFSESLEELDEDNIIRAKTGFKETTVWDMLYKFQRDGVLGAIDKLQRYNGCIIADSVGLGKTFEALAVIKYYELRNERVLVLCPKKLRENWTIYTINDKRNPLLEDRFNYDVLNHTDLSRDRGMSGEMNLETINWGNYDLLVIDESHNFRNSGTKKGGATRYQNLMDDVIRSGVRTKVLMLSATPVNNRMNDLKNQVAFITEGDDKALAGFKINSINQTLRKAQKKFNEWLDTNEEERSTASLLDNMNFDYFKLLDLLTIARSRKHIEKYYDTAEIGKFPERLQPVNIKADIDQTGAFPPLEEVNKTIRRLNLAAYAPLEYVRADKQAEYSRKYDQEVKGGKATFKQVDRERSMVNLMRVNMLKRMESSISSFRDTVGKIYGKITLQLEMIQKHKEEKSNEDEFEELSIEDVSLDDPLLEDYLLGNKVKVLIQDLDLVRLEQDLQSDKLHMEKIIEAAAQVEEKQDAKLYLLKELLRKKQENPLNPGNKKAVIFTAFSDTAEYLYAHLAPWAQETLGLHSAIITGSNKNKTTLQGINKDLNSLLTWFSPVSKKRDKIAPEATEEIDLLIATDCISEGQNLQDCDMLINYDIHWNPVRIIQRFGRIDRLGSTNEKIQLVNFWPNMELDDYINLEARVSGRMVLLDISATGEENVIEYDENNPMNDLEYRRKQMQQLQDKVVDLEDMDGSVSITDMTLNDFRMDLSGFMKERLTDLERAPSGFFAVVQSPGNDIPPGAIFCLRDLDGKVAQDSHYALAPYYLVYMKEEGELLYGYTQGKKSLDILKKLCALNKETDAAAVAKFSERTNHGKQMEPYQTLLEKAAESIIGRSEEKGVESLFSPGGTTLSGQTSATVNDFEVTGYLVVTAP